MTTRRSTNKPGLLQVTTQTAAILEQARLSANSRGSIAYNNILVGNQQVTLRLLGTLVSEVNTDFAEHSIHFKPHPDSLEMIEYCEKLKKVDAQQNKIVRDDNIRLKLKYSLDIPNFTCNVKDLGQMELVGLPCTVIVAPGFYHNGNNYGLFLTVHHLEIHID